METRVCKKCGQELPVENFWRNGFGYSSVCTLCAREKRRETRKNRKNKKDYEKELSEARNLRLQDFTPRELMERLAELGYKGKLTYTKVVEIDLGNF